MTILVLSDLHGSQVDRLLYIKGIDMVLVLGDITTGGSLENTKRQVNALRHTYRMLYAIPGNWEHAESRAWLESEGISLDGYSIKQEGLLLYGIGGSITTPFSTPNEFPDEEFPERLRDCPEPDSGDRLILLSHTPPYGACDRTGFGSHVGSRNLRSYIEERHPELVLCGHIHEARGMDRIGSTIVVNPGTAPKHYATVDVQNEISVKLF
ncbi:metallophosphoesterase [candidate division WOR-3 bacterium]|nr:metallophosphoesterase [candidate division WOR-3 bacterium]